MNPKHGLSLLDDPDFKESLQKDLNEATKNGGPKIVIGADDPVSRAILDWLKNGEKDPSGVTVLKIPKPSPN